LLTPPGPKKLPLLGNLFDIPPNCEWLTYAQWTKDYGLYTNFSSSIVLIVCLDSNILHINIYDDQGVDRIYDDTLAEFVEHG